MPEYVWDENPRTSNLAFRSFAILLTAGFPLAILSSAYVGNLDALKFYGGSIACVLAVGILWWLVAALFMFTARIFLWLHDAARK